MGNVYGLETANRKRKISSSIHLKPSVAGIMEARIRVEESAFGTAFGSSPGPRTADQTQSPPRRSPEAKDK